MSSNDGDESSELDYIKNTSWTYSSDEMEHAAKKFKDYENETLLKDLLNQCPDIKYTAGERKSNKKESTIDLCEEKSHEPHIQASLDFYDKDCVFKEKSYKYVQSVVLNEESCDYTFEKGSYIGSYGIGYVSYTVKEYGIYRASTSGDVLALPLDGNYTYNMKIKKYQSSVKKETVRVNEVTASYSIKNNEISIVTGDAAWDGSFNKEKGSIKLKETHPNHKEKYVLTKRL